MTREQEAAIVRKVLGGDANAFETLVLEYEKNVSFEGEQVTYSIMYMSSFLFLSCECGVL